MRFFTVTTLISALAFTVATAAAPLSVRVGPNKDVSYEDLDINTAAGARVLYERIGKAAREICEAFRSMDSLYEKPFEACYAKTVADSVAAIDSAMIRQVHARALAENR